MPLIVFVENLVTALDNGNCVVGPFLDFQKAFDTVDHCILFDKLSFYGVRGIAHHASERSMCITKYDHSHYKCYSAENKRWPFIYPAEYSICEPPELLQYRDIHVQILQ